MFASNEAIDKINTVIITASPHTSSYGRAFPRASLLCIRAGYFVGSRFVRPDYWYTTPATMAITAFHRHTREILQRNVRFILAMGPSSEMRSLAIPPCGMCS